MHEYLEEFIHFAVTLIKVLLVSLFGGIKALLPMGVLPRKSVNGTGYRTYRILFLYVKKRDDTVVFII